MTRRSPPTARVIRLLELLAQSPGVPLTFSEIARRVDITRATCHALLLTLSEAGYLVRDPSAKTYTLGPALVELGEAARQTFPSVQRAHAELVSLSEATGRPCVAIAPVDDDLLVVDRAGAIAGDWSVLGGQRIPFRPPFGAAAVAFADDGAAEAWIARGAGPDGAPDDQRREALRQVLADVRTSGYAVFPLDDAGVRFRAALSDLAEDVLSDELRAMAAELLEAVNPRDYLLSELRAGKPLPVDTVTAPVFDADGRADFLVCVQLVRPAATPELLEGIAGQLLAATGRMTAAGGGQAPERPQTAARTRKRPSR